MKDPRFYLRPVFAVADLEASLAYYCQALGFGRDWQFPASKPFIAQINRDDLDLILDAGSVIPRAANPSVLSLTLHQGEELDGNLLVFWGQGT